MIYESRLRRQRRLVRTALVAAMVVLFAVAAATLGPWLWQVHRDRVQVDTGQAALAEAWQRQPDLVSTLVDAPPPAAGGPVGRLFVPRLNLNWIMVDAVDEQSLRSGPGHFPWTADPGQRGNFAVAGHRSPGMWIDLDQVKAGDPIIVETKSRWYTYRTVSTRVVLPNDLAEINPVPPGMAPGRLLTLMTCWPRWDNTHRLFVHAVLERTSPADEVPGELTEGDH